MRRLPVYLLLDCSGSMSGEPIEAVKSGMQMLLSGLRQDPQALESAYLSVITFDSSAKQLVPLTDLASFQMPDIMASGTTALGEALSLLCQCAKNEIVKSTPEVKGDWRPLVFIMTDGEPTDDFNKGLAEFQTMKWGITVSCAAGQGANVNTLKAISPESVVMLDTADKQSLAAFFKWVSSSISTSSKSVNDTKQEINGIDQLPPPPPEINMV